MTNRAQVEVEVAEDDKEQAWPGTKLVVETDEEVTTQVWLTWPAEGGQRQSFNAVDLISAISACIIARKEH